MRVQLGHQFCFYKTGTSYGNLKLCHVVLTLMFALTEHSTTFHNNMNINIAHFELELRSARLAEAIFIDRFRPELNRKHERI